MTRRTMVGGLAAGAAALAAPADGRYRLGVMAAMYAALPVEEAMARIRKAGYRYISVGPTHGADVVFQPQMAKPERAAMRRRILDAGVEPFLSLGGFSGDPQTAPGLKNWLDHLDLCADFQIPIMVGGGPWYFRKFPTLPKRDNDWMVEVSRYYAGLEHALRHAEQVKVTVALKPHTGITARAKDCIEVMKRLRSPQFRIAWDAGNVSFYEGIYPDPDLADLAPHVAAVCIKDHLGGRAEANFPVPGQGNIDHDEMFRTLFAAGFNGPLAIERVDGIDRGKVAPEVIDERLAAAHRYLAPLLDRITAASR